MPIGIRPKTTVQSMLLADIGGFRRRGAESFAFSTRGVPALERDVTRLCERASKVIANAGMGDANQGFGALAQAEPEQIHRAVFGDDPVHMSTRSHDTSAGLQ